MDDEQTLDGSLTVSPALFLATIGVAATGLAGMVVLSGALGAVSFLHRSLGSLGVKHA